MKRVTAASRSEQGPGLEVVSGAGTVAVKAVPGGGSTLVLWHGSAVTYWFGVQAAMAVWLGVRWRRARRSARLNFHGNGVASCS